MIPKKRRSISKVQKSRLKPISAAKSKVKREYKRVCDEIDQEMLSRFDRVFCTSCNTTVATWSGGTKSWGHSHNLPKGNFPQFEVDPDNISPRCQGFDGCHEALDSHNYIAIQYFKDLDQIMEYRKLVAPGEYNKFVTGLREVGCFNYAYVEFEK